MIKKIIIMGLILIVSGCSTYAVNRYSISTDNVMALKALDGASVNIGEFTSTDPGLSEIMCRGVGPIKTPDGQSFSSFIQKALTDELKIAGIFSSSSAITLTGNLDSIDFSSSSGNWRLALTVNSSNNHSIKVAEDYSFTSSFYGETACNQTAQALMPAIQNLIGKVVSDPGFHKLVK